LSFCVASNILGGSGPALRVACTSPFQVYSLSNLYDLY